MRETLKVGMRELIAPDQRPPVPPNAGKQNSFYAKVEGQIANCEQYGDELTQAIALSVIPEDIVGLSGNPVDQLKALLAWFKRDFFTWTDKPACVNCQPSDPEKI